MSAWISSVLDIVLIALVGAGLVQATRLIRQLAGLHRGRNDMERFVREFNATVLRAEAGIKGLKQAARDSGDDLEKLVEKAGFLRDELQFIVESADQVASRLSQSASSVLQPAGKQADERGPAPDIKSAPAHPSAARAIQKPAEASASRAEKELIQALEKLG